MHTTDLQVPADIHLDKLLHRPQGSLSVLHVSYHMYCIQAALLAVHECAKQLSCWQAAHAVCAVSACMVNAVYQTCTESLQQASEHVCQMRLRQEGRCTQQSLTPVVQVMTTELYSKCKLTHLALQTLLVRHQGWKLASLVQPRSQQTRDLLDDCLTGQEGTVLLSCNITGSPQHTVLMSTKH